MFSTLESEIQDKLIDEEIKSHTLIPVNNHSKFKTEKLKIEALAKVDLITSFDNFSKHFKTKKETEKSFLEIYNAGEYLKGIFKILETVSRSSLCCWIRAYKENGSLKQFNNDVLK